jgi:hypothetical protein
MVGDKRTARCSNGACGEFEETEDGFRITSTTEGNDGAVILTPAETAKFFADIKAGHFDDMHRAARERAEALPVIA